MLLNSLQQTAQRIVASSWFSGAIIAFIVLNGILVGLDTSVFIHAHFATQINFAYDVILWIFIVEALIKMMANYPRVHHYFRDGWNCFDFAIIVFCLIPATGELAMIARIARLLRVVRIVSVLPQLRVLVTALIHSLPGMINVVLLMTVIFYVYGVAGYHLFHQVNPTHWESLGVSLLTLFRIVTLEDWTDIMYTALESYWWAWIYFLSFVVIATFVIINLFIGIVVTNVQDAKEAQLAALREELDTAEVIRELKQTREALKRVQDHMEKSASSEERKVHSLP
ncbi:MAG: ion transporter [Gammaproteobacteria bacterium]|nr:ion transporter [Gammaproteobacteria bacterium]